MLNNKQKQLYEILIDVNIIGSINNNIDILLSIIPELKDMIGFHHNHPHHHLDVFNHTLLALSLSESDFEIRLCLLLHDIGKPHNYQDGEVRHFKGHPEKSSEMSKVILSRLGYNSEFVEKMCYLIKNHDNPISKREIIDNYDLCFQRYLIQYCDALAHNPERLEKRIQYLKHVLEQFKLEEQEKIKTKVKYNI